MFLTLHSTPATKPLKYRCVSRKSVPENFRPKAKNTGDKRLHMTIGLIPDLLKQVLLPPEDARTRGHSKNRWYP